MLTDVSKTLLKAKKSKKLTYAQIGEKLGHDKVWVAALFYGQARASEEEVAALAALFDINESELAALTDFPVKGDLGPTVPTDPLIYRLYEVVQVYGLPIKAVIQEEFGDGILSAIDFSMSIERQEDPKGDRIILTLNGKFLPYKKW